MKPTTCVSCDTVLDSATQCNDCKSNELEAHIIDLKMKADECEEREDYRGSHAIQLKIAELSDRVIDI